MFAKGAWSAISPDENITPVVTSSKDPNKPVAVEALVLMKIMRHCREYFPTPVNGLLVGLGTDDYLEVTDCFGLQNKRDLWNQIAKEKLDAKEVDEKLVLEDIRYQLKMVDQLILVNSDSCNVGWYQTLQFNDLKDPTVVEGLFDHQELVPDAVVIGFDPQLAHLGSIAFRAFRVTNQALKIHGDRQSSDSSKQLNRLSSSNVLVEAPLEIRNALNVQFFLMDWFAQNQTLQQAHQWDIFQKDYQSEYIYKTMEFACACFDDLYTEQEKLMRFHRDTVRAQQKQKELTERRRIENEQRKLRNEPLLPEIPSILKRDEPPCQFVTALLSNHINRLTQKLSTTISDNLTREFLLHQQA